MSHIFIGGRNKPWTQRRSCLFSKTVLHKGCQGLWQMNVWMSFSRLDIITAWLEPAADLSPKILCYLVLVICTQGKRTLRSWINCVLHKSDSAGFKHLLFSSLTVVNQEMRLQNLSWEDSSVGKSFQWWRVFSGEDLAVKHTHIYAQN